MITRGIREFVARDWQSVRDSKDTYWRDRIAARGPAEAFRVADELRRQVIQQHPGWPDAALRREDLLSHVNLAERFRRADSARRR